MCQPANEREALEEIVRSAAAGILLTLIDRSLTQSEVERVGLDFAVINRELKCAVRYSAHSFPCWLSGAENPDFVLELFTSGSTGLPSKVAHTLDTLGRAVRVGDRHAADVWALAYPATHVGGVQVALQAIRNRNTLVDVSSLRGADAAEAISRHGVTHISATPTYYRLLASAKLVMPLVRAVALGGEPADRSLLDALHVAFPNARLRNIYASTEAGTVLESENDLFAVPTALVNRVRLEDGRLMLHRSLLGVFGEVAKPPDTRKFRLEGVAKEKVPFANNPSPSTAAVDSDAWYDTGDVAEVVSSHPLRFRIVGRQKEWVNIGGDKVNPQEVEDVFRQHPLVLDAVVYGRKNSVLGSLLEAEVVLAAERTAAQPAAVNADLLLVNCPGGAPIEAQLRAWLVGRLQAYKVPRIIRFVAKLNSTSSGKALRR